MIEFRSLAWRFRLVSARLVRSSQTATGRPASNNTTSRRRTSPVLPPKIFLMEVIPCAYCSHFATRHVKSVLFLPILLYPILPFEPNQRQKGGNHHHGQRVGIAPGPIIFRHVLEIHAVHADDQHRRYADDRSDGENLHHLILIDVDDAAGGVLQKLDAAHESL